ncbi:MAG: YidB family protein [Methylophilaceae bacterium]
MGLLDSIAGAVMGKLGGTEGGMAQIALDMFNQHGGLNGVLDKLKSGGLGDQVASWVSTGENQAVSADQITSALGSSQIADLAAKFGITPEVLSGQLAQHLPDVINKLTPHGEVPADSGNLLTTVLGMLK